MRWTFMAAGLVVMVAAGAAPAAAAGPPDAPVVSAARSVVVFGSGTRLTGSAGAPGVRVDLVASPFPFRTWRPAGTVAAGPDGRFAFRVRPDRATRYRVLVTRVASAPVGVSVRERASVSVRALPLGRVRVVVVSRHPRDLRWGGRVVVWSVAAGRVRASARTRTRNRRAGVTVLTATFSVPAGRVRVSACVPSLAVGPLRPAAAVRGCRGRGYAGVGSAPAGFPAPPAIRAVRRYLRHRAGRVAFAVVDSEGRLNGVHLHWRFVSASVVKAMLLVAYLRRLDAEHRRGLGGFARAVLGPMIHVSDNGAATAVWRIVGDRGLRAVARRAGMSDYGVVGSWARSQISAADQARFFFAMDRLVPRHFRPYARRLLSSIVGYESWGVPHVARPRHYAVYFKGGWRGTALGQLVHQVARLERPGRTCAIAVLTDGDPSMGYGIHTIEGVARTLLRR